MLYLHIGAPKTGSNSIQRYMQVHADALERVGLLYPDIGREGRHKHATLNAELRAGGPTGGASFEALRQLRKQRPDDSLFISEEAFYHLDREHVARLAGMLGDGPVQILVWYRDVASYAVSIYGQAAKAGRRTVDFDAFLENFLQWPTHADVISRWGDAFGWDKLVVRTFGTDTLVDGDAVADCLVALGIDRSRVPAPGLAAEKTNASPGWESVEITRCVCDAMDERVGRGGRPVSSALRAAIRKAAEEAAPAGSRIEYLTAEQRALCNARTRADIEALNARLPAPLAMPKLRDGPPRAMLPSIDAVPSRVVGQVLAAIALELGADMPDVKRARKKDRIERVAGSKRERRAKREAADASALPRAPKKPGKTRRKDEKAKRAAEAAATSAAPAPTSAAGAAAGGASSAAPRKKAARDPSRKKARSENREA